MATTKSNPATKLCFVIGPIGSAGSSERKHADMLLNLVVKEVMEGPLQTYKVRRADEDSDPGMITDRVINDILNADLVIADLTGNNPNVYYELGIRHFAQKPAIHITAAGTKLPFDTLGHRTIFVDLGDWESITSGRQRLAMHVAAINAPEYRVSNPITQAKATLEIRESADPRDQIIAELQERIGALEQVSRINRAVAPGTFFGADVSNLGEFIRTGRTSDAITLYQKMFRAQSRDAALEFVGAARNGDWLSASAIHAAAGGSEDITQRFITLLRRILQQETP